MIESSELQRLESFVTRLIGEFAQVRKENERLQQELEEKNNAIVELNDRIKTQELEREEIGQRVGRIISQFESWEKDLVLEGELETEEEQVVQEIAEAETQIQENDLFGRVHGYGKE